MEQFAAVKRAQDGQPVRYLVVDDSVFARRNLARIIESFGGQLAGEAGDGTTAITEYERTQPDIVLMDITMPQMEGIEAAEKIVQPTSRGAHCDGLFRRLSGEHRRGVAARGAPFRTEAGETRSAV